MEPHNHREVIDLVSDDEDSEENEDWHDAFDDYEDEVNFDEPSPPAQHPEPHPPRHNHNNDMGFGVMPEQTAQERKNECFAQLYQVLPEICPEYLEDWYLKRGGIENGNTSSVANNIIASIFEEVEKGKPFPKREQISHGVKRKRELTAAEQAQQMYGGPDRDDANAIYKVHSYVQDRSHF